MLMHILQNNKQNYAYAYLNFYAFGQKTDRQKSLHRMTASIPSLQSALNFDRIQFDSLR
jgi:hypothetical protein